MVFPKKHTPEWFMESLFLRSPTHGICGLSDRVSLPFSLHMSPFPEAWDLWTT